MNLIFVSSHENDIRLDVVCSSTHIYMSYGRATLNVAKPGQYCLKYISWWQGRCVDRRGSFRRTEVIVGRLVEKFRGLDELEIANSD